MMCYKTFFFYSIVISGYKPFSDTSMYLQFDGFMQQFRTEVLHDVDGWFQQ